MKNFYLLFASLALLSGSLFAQTQPKPVANPPAAPQPRQTARIDNRNVTDLTEYGVRILPDTRLIVVMAALDAAGFNSSADSTFHQQLRKDTGGLDPELRRRMRDFFVRANRGLEKATPTDQAARYVSLAYSLTPVPDLAEPARSTELPGGLLEVLDFAPLVREFYRQSGIAEKLPDYARKYQAIGDGLRPNVARAVSNAASYLNTRPQLSVVERIVTTNQETAAKKSQKGKLRRTETRERERHFYVVPDLLAVPNSAKFRVIGDDYFVIIGASVQPESSTELRRAYLQFLVDPLVYKNAKEIAAQREQIRALLEERRAAGAANVTPDVFLAVARSMVVAADVMQARSNVINYVTAEARRRIDSAKTPADKKAVADLLKQTTAQIEQETFANLAEGYETGAVLDYYFADGLRDLESAGFDVTSSLADMITSFDGAKETARLKAGETARSQAIADLAKQRAAAAKLSEESYVAGSSIRSDELVKGLNDVENLLKTTDFDAAENNLREMLVKYPGEPRILYALGRTASLSATNVFDETLRDERLKKAMAHFLNVLQTGSAEPGLLSNTHVALGRIYEFYMDEKAEYKTAAIKEFNSAVALGNVKNGSYAEAVAGKQRLSAQK